MPRPTRFLHLAAACLALAVAPALFAQEVEANQQAGRDGAAGNQARSGQGQPPAAATGPARFDLDFPGGTVEEYVAAIRRAHPPANIVVLAGAGAWGLPPVRLQNVTVAASLDTIQQEVMHPDGGMSLLTMRESRVLGGDEPVYTMSFNSMGRAPKVRTRVWTISSHIAAGITPSALLGAVEASLELDPSASTIRYHEPTALLIVRGTEDQLDVVEHVLVEVINTWATLGEHADDLAD
ncbi:MAG: hypothetical protein EA379_09745 [Phycisphaerales bacterium]|nr:MAG: hypothetical protein EA379_09745 [Phycisphaerales bacterium]